MKLRIGTLMKNEADSLIEWVCYHLAIGVDSFIIANNESSDATEEILELLSEFCNLEYLNFVTPTSSRPQLPAFNYMLEHYKKDCELMAFIDADEFLHPTNGCKKISSFLNGIFSQEDIGALAVNWCNYGSSNAVFKEPGLTIERFTQHSRNDFLANHHYKTIFRAKDAIKFINPHHIKTSTKYISSDGNILINHPSRGIGLSDEVKWENIRINHYVIKSLQEYFVGKALRGNASTEKPVDRKSYFLSYDRNEVIMEMDDDIIRNTYLKIAELLIFTKQKLGRTPIYLQKFEEHLITHSFVHTDLLNEHSISCWAINRIGIQYELVINNADGETRLTPNRNRPDVTRAILGKENIDCMLCGFHYKIEKSKTKSIKITNGFIEHVIYSAQN